MNLTPTRAIVFQHPANLKGHYQYIVAPVFCEFGVPSIQFLKLLRVRVIHSLLSIKNLWENFADYFLLSPALITLQYHSPRFNAVALYCVVSVIITTERDNDFMLARGHVGEVEVGAVKPGHFFSIDIKVRVT